MEVKQLVFLIVLLVTLGIFAFSMYRIFSFMKFTRPFPIGNYGKRIWITLKVALGQTKIFRKPIVGLMHALVFWGFLVILFGTIEMTIDGIFGTEKVLRFLGVVYDVIIASGDIFALIVAIAVIAFLVRRIFMHINRFYGVEMKPISKIDANIALTIILILMISLLGMNTFYILMQKANGEAIAGVYPISMLLADWFDGMPADGYHFWYEFNWWMHIVWIFIFANILPYSKHFHVFLSIPNVFLSRLEPLGYLPNMPEITKEVKLMMDPDAAFSEPAGDEETPSRFGVKDAEDTSWKNYLDSLACTECGRCTAVCPANITGKLLSPRKIVMDLRARMKEKGPGLIKEGLSYDDNRALIRDWITAEELWACTTCNACAKECPVNINHPTLIVDMRRYLVMEESAGPGDLNTAFTNIENNGAPWQFSPEDRMNWAQDLYMNRV